MFSWEDNNIRAGASAFFASPFQHQYFPWAPIIFFPSFSHPPLSLSHSFVALRGSVRVGCVSTHTQIEHSVGAAWVPPHTARSLTRESIAVDMKYRCLMKTAGRAPGIWQKRPPISYKRERERNEGERKWKICNVWARERRKRSEWVCVCSVWVRAHSRHFYPLIIQQFHTTNLLHLRETFSG